MQGKMTDDLCEKIMVALRPSWKECILREDYRFDESIPAYNRCIETSILIYEEFGGEIFKTDMMVLGSTCMEPHYYNKFGKKVWGFSVEQFSHSDLGISLPKNYMDISINIPDLIRNQESSLVHRASLDCLRKIFKKKYQDICAS